MTETTCAGCDMRAELQWRIDLEERNGSANERTQYRLCRGCWEDFCGRFAGATP